MNLVGRESIILKSHVYDNMINASSCTNFH